MVTGKLLCRNQTCSKTMPGSLGHEEQDAKTFASWAPSLIGCDIRALDDTTTTKQLGSYCNKLGVQGKKVKSKDDLEIWAGPLSYNKLAMVLWNRSSSKARVTASWTDLGLEPRTSVDARDLWEHSTQSSVF
ncbi:alpha-galactosidase-like [Cicer arietinum]|uniref:alpha-galactosidase-like n=1 Tax=Cicer arietinum TaxID=3827 RepID=UPI003CC6D81E